MRRPRAPVFLERRSYRRRRLGDAARLLPLFGLVLVLLPLLWSPDTTGAARLTAWEGVYLFAVWAVLILVAAILSLAEQLGLGTLAEGVETQEEHAMLAQLGCKHVQGYVIARPMPFDDVAAWIAHHRAGLRPLPRIGSRVR